MIDTPYRVENLAITLNAYIHWMGTQYIGENYNQRFAAALVFMLVQSYSGKHPDARIHLDPRAMKEFHDATNRVDPIPEGDVRPVPEGVSS
jgi:hypothetical protein